MQYAYTLFSSLIDFLTQIFNATNTTSLFIAGFSIVVVFRFLIKPIIGGGRSSGSDKVKKSKERSVDSE